MADKPAHDRRIGFHVSIAGRLAAAVERALERGCTALQVFCGNPRGWPVRERSTAECQEFRRARSAADLTPLVVHSCYLINPCSPRRAVFRRSVTRLTVELESAAALGADYYVLHPGSHKGKPADWGLERATEAIAGAFVRAASSPPILLENTASAHGPGGDLDRLGALIRRLRERVPAAELGIAVDSCHAFAAGYDFREESEVSRLVEDIDKAVGLERLRLLHVNDSRDGPGSKRDRHWHIGQGTIGRKGLRNFLNHPALAALPLILETPTALRSTSTLRSPAGAGRSTGRRPPKRAMAREGGALRSTGWESVEVDRRNLEAALKLLAAGPAIDSRQEQP